MRSLRLLAVTLVVTSAPLDAIAQTTLALKLIPSHMDQGWRGLAHHQSLLEGGEVLLASLSRCDDDLALCTSNADCATGACTSTCDLPAGQCELSGPLVPLRCARDFAPCTTNADCGLGPCAKFTSPPIPTSASNTSVCMTSFAEGDITGTYDPSSGESRLAATLRWRAYLGITADRPCPRCGAPGQNPQIGASFTCEGGEHDAEPCTVDAVNPVFGGVSYDCPPDITANVSGLGLRIALPEITTGSTRRTAAIPCFDSGVCADTNAACATNADCKRCTNDLAVCTTNEDCPGGVCAAAPEQPVACGFYCHCAFCSEDPDRPCFSTADCPAGQTCAQASEFIGRQEQPNACENLQCGRSNPEECCGAGDANCDAPTAQIGRCSLKRYLVCQSDIECSFGDAGTCIEGNRSCFEHVIERTGNASRLGAHCIDDPAVGACSSNADCAVGDCVENTVEPTYVALACMPKSSSAAVNYSRGMPGPLALTFNARLSGCDGVFDQRRLAGGKLKVNGVNRNTTAGDEDLVVTGTFDFPGELADVDPPAAGVRLLLYAANGDLLADVGVPAGAAWSIEQPGDGPFPSAKFLFTDPTGANDGIRRLKVRAVGLPQRTPVFVRVVVRDGHFPVTATDLPLRAAVVVGDAVERECADTAYVKAQCAFGPLGRRVLCE